MGDQVDEQGDEFNLYVDNINTYRLQGFNWTEIAKLLIRLKRWRKSVNDKDPCVAMAAINDEELDAKVQSISVTHPNSGEVMMDANLRAQNIKVTRKRLRESIHRVDPSCWS